MFFCKNWRFLTLIFKRNSAEICDFCECDSSGKVTYGLTANLDLCVEGYVCLGFLRFFEAGDIRTIKSGVKICDFLIGSNPIKPH